MKKKLFTLLTLLLCLCSTAWADDTVLLEEHFNKCDGVGGNDGTWYVSSPADANKITSSTLSSFFTDAIASIADNSNFYAGKGCLLQKGGTKVLTLKKINKTSFTNSAGVLTFKVGGQTTGTTPIVRIKTDKATVNESGNAASKAKTNNDYTPNTAVSAGSWTTYTILISNVTDDLTITIKTTNAFIDDIVLTTEAGSGKSDPQISISPSGQIELTTTGTQQLTVTRSGTGTISYSPSNENIATVSSSGLISAAGGYGSTHVTATVAETDDYLGDSKYVNVIVKGTAPTILQYAKFNDGTTCNPEGFAVAAKGTSAASYHNNYTGTYGGTTFTKGLKMEGSTTISFTTNSVSTLVVVQSLNTNVNNINIDNTDFATNYSTNYYYDDETNGVRVYVISSLAAGNHVIKRASSELGILYVGVTEAPAPSLTVSPTSATAFAYAEGNGPSAAQTFTITGSNLTSTITATLSNTDAYEMRTGENAFAAGPLTDLASGTAVQVRLKAGLAKGDSYNGNLTFSTTGADNKVIALTGSVTGQTYTVTYDLNGASGDAPTQAAQEAGAVFALAAAPTRDCYTFNGWKCNVDNVTYNAEANYTMTAAPTTFTAQWTANYASGEYVFEGNQTLGTSPNQATCGTGTTSDFRIDNIFFKGGTYEYDNGNSGGSGDGDNYNGWKWKSAGTIKFVVANDQVVTIGIGSIKSGASATVIYTNLSGAATNATLEAGQNHIYTVKAGTMVTITHNNSSNTVTLKKILINNISTPADPTEEGETVTLTTSNNMAGWRAFNPAGQGYTLDANTTAYIVTAAPADNKVKLFTLAEANGDIPGNTPVILKTSSSADSYKMTLTKKAGIADYAGDENKLKVTTAAQDLSAGVCRLGFGTTGIGFYAYATASAPVGIIYLDATPAAAAGKGYTLVFESEATGINAIDNGELTIDNDAPMYNLAGQKVTKSYKGVVIQNGKKYINK